MKWMLWLGWTLVVMLTIACGVLAYVANRQNHLMNNKALVANYITQSAVPIMKSANKWPVYVFGKPSNQTVNEFDNITFLGYPELKGIEKTDIIWLTVIHNHAVMKAMKDGHVSLDSNEATRLYEFIAKNQNQMAAIFYPPSLSSWDVGWVASSIEDQLNAEQDDSDRTPLRGAPDL